MKLPIYRESGKRAVDLLLAVPALILLTPAILAAAAGVKLSLGSPVLFRQLRPGLNEQPFTLLKFRTMKQPGKGAETEASRLTGLGRLLRVLSIDELPELWNVIRGDMSLVGPRPLLLEYLPLYNAEQRRRHAVRPGITGLAQVNGRNELSWEEKFAWDIEYVDKVNFLLDCRIILKTIGKVLMRRGITQPGHATAERFGGSAQAL